MTKKRAEIGFSQSFEDLDLSAFKPEPESRTPAPKPPKEEIRKVAHKTGFQSREAPPESVPAPAPQPARAGRIYRTGRSEQLNLKVRGEDKTGFYAICDRKHWVQGYTFQRAMEALERELTREEKDGAPLTKSA